MVTLINGLLDKDPNKRLSMKEILKVEEVDKAIERVVAAGLSKRYEQKTDQGKIDFTEQDKLD